MKYQSIPTLSARAFVTGLGLTTQPQHLIHHILQKQQYHDQYDEHASEQASKPSEVIAARSNLRSSGAIFRMLTRLRVLQISPFAIDHRSM